MEEVLPMTVSFNLPMTIFHLGELDTAEWGPTMGNILLMLLLTTNLLLKEVLGSIHRFDMHLTPNPLTG